MLKLNSSKFLWTKILVNAFKLEPMKIYCDNKATINNEHNPIQHDHTKHIEVDRHFIKEKIKSRQISTSFVTTKHQLADIFTKGISRTMFDSIVSKLGMHDIFTPA